PRFAAALLAASARFGPGVRGALRGLHAVQIPVRAIGLDTVSPARLRAYQRAGVEVHIWTVNEEPEMRRLLALGIDGLVTDRADLAVEVLRTLR
ncbi:MAG: glycerophosphodiester phosphodiesterase, partial [Yonghaparkia sp.]|nr:glycerophosphodiester phosphodiesterase [Microcella sp.]